jgi:hypothetical protein
MPDHGHEAAGHVVVANGGGLLGLNDENCNMQIKETKANGTAVAVNTAVEHLDTLHEAEEAGEKVYTVYTER